MTDGGSDEDPFQFRGSDTNRFLEAFRGLVLEEPNGASTFLNQLVETILKEFDATSVDVWVSPFLFGYIRAVEEDEEGGECGTDVLVEYPSEAEEVFASLGIRLRHQATDADRLGLELLTSRFRQAMQVLDANAVRSGLARWISSSAEESSQREEWSDYLFAEVGSLRSALAAEAVQVASVLDDEIAVEFISARESPDSLAGAEHPERWDLHPQLPEILLGGQTRYVTAAIDPSLGAHTLVLPYLFDARAAVLIAVHLGRPLPAIQSKYTLPNAGLLPQAFREIYRRRWNRLIVDPLYSARNDPVIRGQCFVLMPFGEVWSDRIWNRVLRPLLVDLGLQAVRADDLYGADVMEDIWRMILTSEFVLADITRRNPNVLYELGLAHAIGKSVVLLTQDPSDIPFDLNRYRHVIYSDDLDGYDRLRRGISGSITELNKGAGRHVL